MRETTTNVMHEKVMRAPGGLPKPPADSETTSRQGSHLWAGRAPMIGSATKGWKCTENTTSGWKTTKGQNRHQIKQQTEKPPTTGKKLAANNQSRTKKSHPKGLSPIS